MRPIQTHLSRPARSETLIVVLLAILALVATAGLGWGALGVPADALVASRGDIATTHQYWRLWTALGAHADLTHLLANLPLFGVLGFMLYGYFGFWAFPIVPFALGGLGSWLTLQSYPEHAGLVGVSGVVYLMAGMWLGLYTLIDRTRPVRTRVMNSLAFSLVLLMPETFDPHVSYLAHAWGFALGLVAAAPFFALRRRALRAAEVYPSPRALANPRAATYEEAYADLPPGFEPYYWLPIEERPGMFNFSAPGFPARAACS